MSMPNFDDFVKLQEKGNLIPVFREQLADTETPVSVLARFAGEENVFLLESVEGGENWGRYSVIGINPSAVFTVHNGRASLFRSDGSVERYPREDPIPFFRLREILSSVKPVDIPRLPRFFAGAVGYIGYETVHQFERLPSMKGDSSYAETCMMLAEDMIVFDNVRHTMLVIACARLDQWNDAESAYEDACQRIQSIEERLLQAPPADCLAGRGEPDKLDMQANMEPEQFYEMVRKINQCIIAGEVIQTVISQKFTTSCPASPLSIYRALRLINPSPYLFFIKNQDHILIGSSPEIMVKLTGNVTELRPIAGTRPRGSTEQEDRALADQLLNDDKERAEHIMLVDLGRNDLGRIAAAGSVQVQDFMTVERYSHVMHIVSHIKAEIKPDHDAFDLIRATFPAGTLTGAPKVRAMEIINQLEPHARGAYGGAVGYIGYDGNLDLAITIRTLEIEGDKVSVQAGAGIVADSKPEQEYEETCSKAQGMMRALELAARNLAMTGDDGNFLNP